MSNSGRKGNELALEQSGLTGGEEEEEEEGRRNDEEWRSFLGSGQERTRREANGPVFASGVRKDRRIAREGKRDRRHRNARKRELQRREDPASFNSLPSTNNIGGADKNRLLWHASRFTLPCLRSSKTEIARGKIYI